MQFNTSASNPLTLKTPCLVLPVGEYKALSASAAAIDAAMGGLISRLLKNRDISSAIGQTLLLQEPAGIAASRLLLVGAGEKPLNEQQFCKLAQTVSDALAKTPCKTATIALDGLDVESRNSHWQARQLAKIIGSGRLPL